MNDFVNAVEEPRIILRNESYGFNRKAVADGLRRNPQTFRRRRGERGPKGVGVVAFSKAAHVDGVKPRKACLQRPQGFLQGLRESSPDRHRFADGFHGGR